MHKHMRILMSDDTTNDAGLTVIPNVFERDGAAFADSRDVAAFFGKLHKDVLKAIRNLLVSPTGANLRWFAERSYVIAKPIGGTEERPFYELTRCATSPAVQGGEG